MHILVLHLLKYTPYAVEKSGFAELAINCDGVYISHCAMIAMSATPCFHFDGSLLSGFRL